MGAARRIRQKMRRAVERAALTSDAHESTGEAMTGSERATGETPPGESAGATESADDQPRNTVDNRNQGADTH